MQTLAKDRLLWRATISRWVAFNRKRRLQELTEYLSKVFGLNVFEETASGNHLLSVKLEEWNGMEPSVNADRMSNMDDIFFSTPNLGKGRSRLERPKYAAST